MKAFNAYYTTTSTNTALVLQVVLGTYTDVAMSSKRSPRQKQQLPSREKTGKCRLRENQHTTSSKVRRRVVRFRSTEQKPTFQNHIKFVLLSRREPKHTETSVLQYKDFINLRFPICRATRLFGRYNIFRQTPSNSH